MKSPWTYRHSDLVAMIAARIAAALGADEAEVTDLRRAAMLHDIGKLAISNRILDKAGGLTGRGAARWCASTRSITARILERIPGFAHLAPLAAAHHERLDGSGYPYGLRAENLTHADARARGRRRLRGDDLGAPIPAGDGRRGALAVLRADAARLDGDVVTPSRTCSSRPGAGLPA